MSEVKSHPCGLATCNGPIVRSRGEKQHRWDKRRFCSLKCARAFNKSYYWAQRMGRLEEHRGKGEGW